MGLTYRKIYPLSRDKCDRCHTSAKDRGYRDDGCYDNAESLPSVEASGGPTAGLVKWIGWGESVTDLWP